jgi:flagellar biosynthesis protein FlhF
MKVKKYIVDSMPDALQKIRAELGKDAVIINTKEIRVGGFLGMFTKKKVEVVAATDSHPESASIARPQMKAQSAAVLGKAAPSPIPPYPRAERRPLEPTAAAASQAPFAIATNPFLEASAEPVKSSNGKEDVLLQEMKQMKEMMQRLATAQSATGVALAPAETLAPAFISIRERLVEQDVRPDLAGLLVEQAAESLGEGRVEGESKTGAVGVSNTVEVPVEQAQAAVKEQIVAILTKRPTEQIRPDARIVHFVGPTGVGKTTTIAKLAADQALKHRKAIGLITSDTYRIAAIEQLRTYASILNVPLEVVFSPLDLKKALEKMEDRDMILMDTAGRNYRNEMAVSELHSLLRTEEKKDTFLVLSLSMKYNDMKSVTDNFHKFGLEKVLFTKADETATFGSVVNLLYDFPLSLSYITDGQNVPDDINLADARSIADELVGEPHDE